ncbi:MAG: hypothetical protein KKB51_00005 [Candidatus Riflebacteria bacterium]|nr:hypothetical protein [Candidatus Riflebacteria bacterium]
MSKSRKFVDMGKSYLNDLIHWLSFNNEISHIVDKLNQTLEEPLVKLGHRHVSHPGGFSREFVRRRLTMAEAYIIITKVHNPECVETRLQALRTLTEQSMHAKTITMPINTARVQIFLIKEALKAQGDRRRQMELVADFGRASFGNESVIRGFLKDHGLIEVPEEGKPLKALNLGWDDHVHDSMTEGRKTPTRVLIDAFVKGLSRITLLYNSVGEEHIISEAIVAGEILGISVEIGIEFSVGPGGSRRHYIYVPPVFRRSRDLHAFFKEHETAFIRFREGLQKNIENRYRSIVSVIRQFNETHLPKLNEDFTSDSPCWFAPLEEAELQKIVAYGQPSREHLGELLFERFSVVFLNRVLFFKVQSMAAEKRFRRGNFSQWELDTVHAHYHECRQIYIHLSRADLADKYLASRSSVDYDSSFEAELPLLKTLRDLPGKVILIHPVALGLKNAIKHVIEFAPYITHLETMNLRDSAARNPSDLIVFNKFVFILNNRPVSEIHEFLEQQDITGISAEAVENARNITETRAIIPICGSDSSGRNKLIPGMGFIRTSMISPAIKKRFLEKHFVLPLPISKLILNQGKWSKELPHEDSDHETIICMGKQLPPLLNKVGDERDVELIKFSRFWRYLNPDLKNLFRLTTGFSFALYWMIMFQFDADILTGAIFAALWFLITFSRNVLVDLIASSGTDFKRWSLHNVNFDNAYQSLFWTGFSVPILGLVKNNFDTVWPYLKSGMLFESSKFFCICIANGIYISTHNRLRNFDRKVIKANFFRSVLSWPIATAFAPAGNLLGVPSIVQAKFWSDVVAGFIEGSGKFSQRFTLRKRDLTEIFPRLYSEDRNERITAMLDVLYIWARAPRGKTCLRLLLLNKPSLGEMVWRRHRETPEETQIRAKRYRALFYRLLELYSFAGVLSILTEYALRNFSGHDALELSLLIGRESEDFLAWLKALEKRLPPEDTTAVIGG